MLYTLPQILQACVGLLTIGSVSEVVKKDALTQDLCVKHGLLQEGAKCHGGVPALTSSRPIVHDSMLPPAPLWSAPHATVPPNRHEPHGA